jgi:hypothetical protein
MKGPLNPKLEQGDRIVLFHMDGETSVSPGTSGTVTNISTDPFDPDEEIINVTWDNGSSLAMISSTDAWKKISEKKLDEGKVKTASNEFNFYNENQELFKMFDWKFFREYLKKVRDSGIVNMFGAAPLLYSGREHIDRYYGEDPANEEEFNEVLEMADEAKDKMIQGTIEYMRAKNMGLDIDRVNRVIGELSQKMLRLYMIFY